MPLVPFYDEDEDVSYTDLDYEESTYPSKSYKIDEEETAVNGNVDGIDAIKQAIQCMLQCERYYYPIFSENYGIELVDLIGEPMDYVISEVERRITECLTWDSRIDSVDDFQYEVNGNKLHVTFSVSTILGVIEDEELEVTV